MTKSKIFIAALSLAFMGTASAAELITSVENTKGGATAIGFDIVSDGAVAGLSFSIEVGNLDAKALRSNSCTAQVPKGFSAGCAYANGKINVIASADVPGTFLPSGLAPVGSVIISSPLAKGQAIRVSHFETSNDNGVSTIGTAKVDGVDMGDVAGEDTAK